MRAWRWALSAMVAVCGGALTAVGALHSGESFRVKVRLRWGSVLFCSLWKWWTWFLGGAWCRGGF